jgi:hypothetical protein
LAELTIVSWFLGSEVGDLGAECFGSGKKRNIQCKLVRTATVMTNNTFKLRYLIDF